MGNLKCPQCGLVNFSTDEKCKRCGAKILQPMEYAEDEQSGTEAARTEEDAAPVASELKAAQFPNLIECSDCGNMVSRQARSCPRCGRFLSYSPPPPKTKSTFSELLATVMLIFAGVCALWALATIYAPDKVVGGDAFNYIMAAGKGTAIMVLGLIFTVVGCSLGISATIRQYH
jgi:uncharacterized paraquat-inducible protein A